MKFCNFKVSEINVLDEKDRLVTVLNTLESDEIYHHEHNYYVVCQDALLDLNLMGFISKHEVELPTDLEKILYGNKTQNRFTFGANYNIPCKLVLKGNIRDIKTEKDIEYTIYFPKVNIKSNFSFNANFKKQSTFEKVFECIPYNEKGDILQFII